MHNIRSTKTTTKLTGLYINPQKPKYMRLNTNQEDCLKITDSVTADVQNFTCLGSDVSKKNIEYSITARKKESTTGI